MKLFTSIILLFLVSTCSFGQSRQDQAQILLKCIELSQLQQYYPLEADGSQKPLIINYWHPVLFPTDLTVMNGGKNVEFREMSAENNKNAEAYFLFKKFEVFPGSSLVKFDYSYNDSDHLKAIEVTLELSKTLDKWEIANIHVSNKEQ